MNSNDENMDSNVVYGLPCSLAVQNIIVSEYKLTELSEEKVQGIIEWSSTLLCGSEHYCLCTIS